jgi:hypothetical protein
VGRTRTPPSPKSSAPGARKVIADALAEGVTPDRVKALVDASFASELTATAVCEDCGGAMKVKIPDLKKQVESMVSLLEQAEGRPAANQPEATTVIVERPPL